MMVSSRGRPRTVSALCVTICLWIWQSWQAAALTNNNDLNALRNLKNQWASADSYFPTDWVGNDPCGTSWQGVTCDSTGTYVTDLALPNSNLTGEIPPTIGKLTSLQTLDLSFNPHVGGSLPSELGSLTSLTQLNIMNAGLQGSIPDELGQLTKLAFLAINQNGLTGSIPSAIGNLNVLSWFDISENKLSGPLPVSSPTNLVGLDNLLEAKHFHFYNNSLDGSIPNEIFNLPQLSHLLLDSNNFTGNIPTTTLSGATDLQYLRLDNNQLSGQIPQELTQLTALTELYLGNNLFNQTLPDLSGLTRLQLLDVSGNLFDQEEIPDWVFSLTSAISIFMDGSNLIGNLNASIFSLPNLQYLSLRNNSLNGTLSLGDISTSLQTVNLESNNFSDVGEVNPSVSLRLYGNPLCSSQQHGGDNFCKPVNTTSPSSIPINTCVSCSEGELPNPNVNNCSCLSPLILYMYLTSPPFSSVNASFLQSFTAEWAQIFQGIVGTQIHTDQVYIPLPTFTNVGRMSFWVYLFPLPRASLNVTEVNLIITKLNPTVTQLKEGPYVLQGSALPLFPLSKGKKSTIGIVVGVVVACIVVAVIILLIVAYAIRQKKRADKAEISRPFASWGTMKKEAGEAPQLKGARWFPLAELRKATNNFSEDNEIGVGGYGKVYRAELPGGGVVAVKKAEEGSMQGATEFKNEIELLSRVHHKNLVGLVGFCYENGEQALVYEYMPNGTLRDHLLGDSAPLTWDRRVAIALGSAKGLHYLHELANPPIIHRDIKSGNILLDEQMVAKVADFGLSKLAPEGEDKEHLSTQVKGTMGYLDPEYYMTNQLSEKSDVYSFGVVLLEILSARRPIEHGRYIVQEVRTALNKGGIRAFEALLDPFLGDYPPKQMEALLDLALLCVEEVAAGRPTMMEVVKKLEVINGNSQPSFRAHITIEPQKADDIYGKEQLQKIKDPSFQYSGEKFTDSNVEPK